LVTARQVKLLLQALVLAIGVWLLHPVFGTAITTVGVLLMVFDPFLIAHDRLLHVDSLVALAGFVSLAALLRALGQDRADPLLALSGAFAAVAWLNRTPGVVLAIVAGLVGGGVLWQRRGQGIPLSHAARVVVPQVVWWGGAALVTTVVAWPALWVAPIETYRRVLSGSLRMARMGHDWGTFFYGTTYHADWSLPYIGYYPVSLLWRLTPIALGGLVLVLLGIAVRDRILVPAPLRVPIVILVGYALLYLVTMSLGAKKFDHYLLPVYPVLDLLAAVGIVGVARHLERLRARLGPFLAAAALVGAVGGQLAIASSVAPYYLPYFNPFLGGVPRASEALLLGWGEGMDQVAGFILSQPGGERARVRTTITPTTLLYFLPPSATVTALQTGDDLPSPDVWETTDYVVIYISQWQRDYFPRLMHYLSPYEPVHTVSFGGVDFARTYDVRAIPPPGEPARDS
jgi:4-amino-4-deoxy-L-arabinose transferase-like glycosyltransferase